MSQNKKMIMNKIIALCLIVLSVSYTVNAQEHPFHLTSEGHILIQVTLNGEHKVNFLLDTGAGAIVFSSKTFEKIKNKATEEGYFTGFRHDGDRVDGVLYKGQSIAMGDYKKEDFLFGIYPPLDDYGIDGLISLKFFENQAFSIDFKNQKIKFLSPKQVNELAKDHSTLPLTLDRKGEVSLDISIPICLEGNQRVDAQFDTGSGYGSVILHPYFMNKLKLDPEEAKTSTYKTPISGKELKDSIFTLDWVGLCSDQGRLKMEDWSVVFREDMIHEALIGSELFKNARVTIDLASKRMVVEPQ